MKDKKSLDRREFLKRVLIVGSGAALASCAPKPTPTPKPTATPEAAATATPEAAAGPTTLEEFGIEVAEGAVDPFNIEKGVTVDGVFFAGGYGSDYIEYAADIFEALHPETKVSVEPIQRVADQLRPRFIGGNPPDVVDNSGAGSLDTVALVKEGKLLDLAPLMEAPALDTPDTKFKDTLFPGSQDTGVYEGKQYNLNIAYTVSGIWHSKSLFEEKGWEYPKTWDEMLSLCETIKGETDMAPWTYQGKYPGYMVWGVWYPLIYKIGGYDPLFKVDDLEPDCFTQPAVKQATEMIYQLADKDYIMQGTAGLTHTEAQAEWLKGGAVFVPCGSWLENEMKTITPEGFDMVVKPVPAVADGEGSYEALMTASGEIYFVPAEAKHPQCGMEFLRILLSKASAAYFAEEVSSMMPVKGGTEGASLSPGMKSAVKAAEEAGDETFAFPFYGGVSQISEEISNRMGELLTKQITPDEFIEIMQGKTDEALADPEIEVIKRHQ
ncbi:MAG: N-acetylglucosamine/diacetylchitobiose ABC transporter substrate-binding protein [Chloroflexota bacterium]|nr:N-acetylglucosamine/diacetylchitobiose ABC transporter substrate-binding protein [Chloroflexota bacterium]